MSPSNTCKCKTSGGGCNAPNAVKMEHDSDVVFETGGASTQVPTHVGLTSISAYKMPALVDARTRSNYTSDSAARGSGTGYSDNGEEDDDIGTVEKEEPDDRVGAGSVTTYADDEVAVRSMDVN